MLLLHPVLALPIRLLPLVAWIALALLPRSSQATRPAWLDAAASARLAPQLRARLEAPLPAEGLAVGVVLVERDLPRSPSARRTRIAERQRTVIDAAAGRGFDERRRYGRLAGFAGRAGERALEALAHHPLVLHVYLDGALHLNLAQGRPLVAADLAHAGGFTGAGMVVATIDSGVDTDHPDLADDLSAEACFCDNAVGISGCCPNGRDSQTGAGSAEDDLGHGTAVAGVISSGGVDAAEGVAPDAGIVAVKVFAASGGGSFSDIAAGLDWVLDNHTHLGIRVVNLSLGDSTEYNNSLDSPCSNTNTAKAIRDLTEEGVAVFASSGNESYDDGISFPACAPEAISVGGVYDASLGGVSWCGDESCTTILCTDSSTYANKFVCHTNSDELLDILAPSWRTHTSALDGGTDSFGGTSMASPYAAGAAALLLEQDPGREPDDVRTILGGNGPLVTDPDNGLSFHRIDLGWPFAVCGDGAIHGAEECDDGNTTDGDCCTFDCQAEAFGISCSDEDACTLNDTCDGLGSCQPGSPLVCDDALFCNGLERCDDASGCQPGSPPELDDGLACTDDQCDEDADAVVHVPEDALCDDGIPCTVGSCNAAVGCVFDPTPVCGAFLPSAGPPGRLVLGITLLLLGSYRFGRRSHRGRDPS